MQKEFLVSRNKAWQNVQFVKLPVSYQKRLFCFQQINLFFTQCESKNFHKYKCSSKTVSFETKLASVVSQLVSITFGENLVVSYFVRHIVARGDSWNEGKLRWQTADRSKPPDDNKVGGGP